MTYTTATSIFPIDLRIDGAVISVRNIIDRRFTRENMGLYSPPKAKKNENLEKRKKDREREREEKRKDDVNNKVLYN